MRDFPNLKDFTSQVQPQYALYDLATKLKQLQHTTIDLDELLNIDDIMLENARCLLQWWNKPIPDTFATPTEALFPEIPRGTVFSDSHANKRKRDYDECQLPPAKRARLIAQYDNQDSGLVQNSQAENIELHEFLAQKLQQVARWLRKMPAVGSTLHQWESDTAVDGSASDAQVLEAPATVTVELNQLDRAIYTRKDTAEFLDFNLDSWDTLMNHFHKPRAPSKANGKHSGSHTRPK